MKSPGPNYGSEQFFINRPNTHGHRQPQGPYSLEDINRLLETNSVSPSESVWVESAKKWVRVSSIPGTTVFKLPTPIWKKAFWSIGGFFAFALVLGRILPSPEKPEIVASTPTAPPTLAPVPKLTETPEQVEAREIREMKVQDAQGEKQRAIEAPRANAIMSYMREGFSETSWFGFITDIETSGRTITVRTSLPYVARSDSMRMMWENEAKGICSGVSGYAFANGNRRNGFNIISVVASGGEPYMHRNGIDDGCGI